MSPPDLVLAFHGTEKPAGQQLARRVVLAVAAALPQVKVHLGWADVLTPTLTQTLSAVGPAVVVPCFLASGYHVTSDLPAAVQASGGRARLTPSLGAAPEAGVFVLEKNGAGPVTPSCSPRPARSGKPPTGRRPTPLPGWPGRSGVRSVRPS